jgi:hypothetical protein
VELLNLRREELSAQDALINGWAGASWQFELDLIEQWGRDGQQVRPIWRPDLYSVIVSGLNRKEWEIGNLLERADIATRFLQPIHQSDEVVGEGSHASLGVDPAFEGFFAGLLKSKTDAAVAEARELHHALCLIEISLGDPEVAQGIRTPKIIGAGSGISTAGAMPMCTLFFLIITIITTPILCQLLRIGLRTWWMKLIRGKPNFNIDAACPAPMGRNAGMRSAPSFR